jgi:hypothetical protein
MSKQQPTTSASAEERAALRLRCQTDLFFLAKEILGYRDLVPHVHQQICSTYVRKDPSKPLFEQSDVKTRMVLAPRGCFKTTIDLADIIQWIVCFPNIRILLLTGTQDLAWRMVADVKRQFQTNELLRELFPECCPPPNKKWGNDDEFTCPARTQSFREPTLSSSTLDSVKAGVHVDVLAIDDAVNEVNSNTPLQCQKTIEAYDALTYVLEPKGYTNINGTRYQPWDLYGKLLERHAEQLKRIAEAVDLEDDEEVEVVTFTYTILAAWTFKPEYKPIKDENGRWILTKKDVNLLFPERLKFRELKKQYLNNPRAFCCQMMNNPDIAQDAARPFTSSLVEAHCIPHTQLPFPNACTDYIFWDLAGPNQRKTSIGRDYCVGVVGRLDTDGRLFIIDMVRGQWNATQQAAQIVGLAKNYPSVEYTWIEDSQGTRYLEPVIYNIAGQVKANIALRYVTIPRFEGAKRFRIDALADFLKSDRLWFASFLPNLDTLKAELLDPNPTHDDCSDAIALMVRELGMRPSYESLEEVSAPSLKEYHRQLFEQALFGDGDDEVPAPVVEVLAPEPEPQTYTAGILGFGLFS